MFQTDIKTNKYGEMMIMENHRKTLGFLRFSLIFKGFLISEGSKIMKIRENSANGGKETLREQQNKANTVLKAPERGSRGSQEVAWKAPRAQKIIGPMATLLIFGCPGPP